MHGMYKSIFSALRVANDGSKKSFTIWGPYHQIQMNRLEDYITFGTYESYTYYILRSCILNLKVYIFVHKDI